MNRRTIILIGVLAALIPVAIYVNVRALRGGGTVSTPRVLEGARAIFERVAAVHEEDTTKAVQGRAALFQPVSVNTGSFRRLVASGEWGRDPFLTADEISRSRTGVTAQPAAARDPAMTTLIVSAVLVSGEERVAIINDEFYSVGDVVSETGERVAAIRREGVVLEGSGLRMVPLEQSKILIKSSIR